MRGRNLIFQFLLEELQISKGCIVVK